MTSVTDIRPTIAPLSLTSALEGLDIQGFYGADGSLAQIAESPLRDRKSTRLNSSHIQKSRMPSSA